MEKLRTVFNGLLYALYIGFIGLMMNNSDSHPFFMMVGSVGLIVAPAFARELAHRNAAAKAPRAACRKCGFTE